MIWRKKLLGLTASGAAAVAGGGIGGVGCSFAHFRRRLTWRFTQVPLARTSETILRRFCAILLGTWCVMHGRGQPPWAASPQKEISDENPFCIQCHGRSGGVALALLTGAGAAQARDVNWSIGVNRLACRWA